MTAGYSGTPLIVKLGRKEGFRARIVGTSGQYVGSARLAAAVRDVQWRGSHGRTAARYRRPARD